MRHPGFDFRLNGIPERGDATAVNCPEGSMDCPMRSGDPSKYSAEEYKAKVIELIADHEANHSSSPMYLYLAMQSVHSPLQATPQWLAKQPPLEAFAKYGGQPGRRYQNATERRTYAAMVAEMDDAVGKVVAALEGADLLANGVLFLSADNGGITGGGSGGGFNCKPHLTARMLLSINAACGWLTPSCADPFRGQKARYPCPLLLSITGEGPPP